MAQSFSREQTSGKASLWPVLAPPVIWAVYHTIAYFITEAACTVNVLTGSIFGIPSFVAVVLFLTLLALLPTLFIGWRALQRSRQANSGAPDEESSTRFLGIVAATFSLILALIILADGASIIVLRPCW